MHPLRRKRLAMVAALLVAVFAAAALMLSALRANLNLFRPPGDFSAGAVADGARARLGGLVERGSLRREGDGLIWRFRVADGEDRVEVLYRGLTPDLFAEGRGVVATGRWDARRRIFVAGDLLAKHDENYQPPLP